MASKQTLVDYLVDQLSEAGAVSARKMFGEYGIYFEGKMIALVCDDRLFFKPTKGGRACFESVEEAPPYRGAKPCLLVPEEGWEDRAWLAELVRATARELPEPKPKKGKA